MDAMGRLWYYGDDDRSDGLGKLKKLRVDCGGYG